MGFLEEGRSRSQGPKTEQRLEGVLLEERHPGQAGRGPAENRDRGCSLGTQEERVASRQGPRARLRLGFNAGRHGALPVRTDPSSVVKEAGFMLGTLRREEAERTVCGSFTHSHPEREASSLGYKHRARTSGDKSA